MLYSSVHSTRVLTDTNTFHHVAVTKTGSQVVFCIDGVAESVEPYDPGFVFGGPMVIGAVGGNYNYAGSFYGAIDEVSIYDRALATNEIQAIYNAGSAGKCVPPLRRPRTGAYRALLRLEGGFGAAPLALRASY
jgi:hypothetical protein